MTVKNTFRAGSTCHRAFHHLERSGRCTTAQLAKALEFDEDELPGLLGLALRSGHIRRTGDLWEIGDGTPIPPAASPPAPSAPPPIRTATVPPAVLDIPPAPLKRAASPSQPKVAAPPPPPPPPPAAAPVAPPTPSPAPAPKPEPPAAPAPAPAPALPARDEADRVRITKPLASVRAPVENPPRAQPPEPPPRDAPPKATLEDEKNRRMSAMLWSLSPQSTLPPEGLVEGVMARAARLQEANSTWPEGRITERMCAAWCSDGTYVIEKSGGRLELDLSEVVELWDHLRTVMAGTAE